MVSDLDRRFDSAVTDARSGAFPVEEIAARARRRGRRRAIGGIAVLVLAVVGSVGAFAAFIDGGGATQEVAVRSVPEDAEIVVAADGSCWLADSGSGTSMVPGPPDGRVCIRLDGWADLGEADRREVVSVVEGAASCAEAVAVATLFEVVSNDPGRTEAWLLVPCQVDATELAEVLQDSTAEQVESAVELRFEPVPAPRG